MLDKVLNTPLPNFPKNMVTNTRGEVCFSLGKVPCYRNFLGLLAKQTLSYVVPFRK